MTNDTEMTGAISRVHADGLLAARHYCRIVHHLPGRIRLRVDPVGFKKAQAAQTEPLDTVLGRVSGIQRTEINPVAGSVVIHYDPAKLPPVLWDDLLAGTGAAARSALDALQTQDRTHSSVPRPNHR